MELNDLIKSESTITDKEFENMNDEIGLLEVKLYINLAKLGERLNEDGMLTHGTPDTKDTQNMTLCKKILLYLVRLAKYNDHELDIDFSRINRYVKYSTSKSIFLTLYYSISDYKVKTARALELFIAYMKKVGIDHNEVIAMLNDDLDKFIEDNLDK